jgi:hypothetical protein
VVADLTVTAHHRACRLADLEKRFGLTRAEGRGTASGRRAALNGSPLGWGRDGTHHAKRSMQKTDTHRQARLVVVLRQVGPAEPGASRASRWMLR